jgi:hypothetical protein
MIVSEKNLKKIIKNKLFETRFFLSSEYTDSIYKKWYIYFTKVLSKIILNSSKVLFIEEKYDELNKDYNENFFLVDFNTFDIKNIKELGEYSNVSIPKIYIPTTLFQIQMKYLMINKENEYLEYRHEIPPLNSKILEIEDLQKIFNKIKEMLSDDRIDINLNAKNMSANIGSEYNFSDFNSIEEMEDYLYDIAGPDIFISFSDSYNVNEDGYGLNPEFSLNPNATFGTPHGFYFYPFDKKNVKNFIKYGKPTNAQFATDREYFHLVKIDLNNKKTIIFEKNGICNKKISYENYIKNVKELIRIHAGFFKLNVNDEQIFKKLNYFMQTNYNSSFQNLKYNTEMGIDLDINNLVSNLYKFSFFLSFKDFTNKNFKLFDENYEENESELFSLLLYSIGIRCVIDKGLGIIHENEPDQMHIITFGDDKSFYKYIGTFENWFKKG